VPFVILILYGVSSAYALTPQEALAMAQGEGSARIQAVHGAVVKADAATLAFIQALSDDAVKIVDDKPYRSSGRQRPSTP
jgi:urea transport system permease protein